MFSYSGLKSIENPTAWLYSFEYLFLTAVGSSGGTRCPGSSATCFCETLSKPFKLCLATPQITVRRDPVCLSNKHLSYQLTARLKVDRKYGIHLAWLLSAAEKQRSQLQKRVLARGNTAAQFAAWGLQSESQNHNFKRTAARGFLLRFRSTSKRNGVGEK